MRCLLSLLLLVVVWPLHGVASQQYTENLDDQSFDQPASGSLDLDINMSPGTDAVLNTDFTFATGRGGTGYCLRTAGVNSLLLAWTGMSWPTNELYISFWSRVVGYVWDGVDTNENFKRFYPYFGNNVNYTHFTVGYGDGGIYTYYSAQQSGIVVSQNNYPGNNGIAILDGNWHHFEHYVDILNGISRVWVDDVLFVDENYGAPWVQTTPSLIRFGHIDAEDQRAGSYSYVELDDFEVWDGMPDGSGDTTAPAQVTDFACGSPTSTTCQASFTAVGDDNTTGTATTYDVRCVTGATLIEGLWSGAPQLTGEPSPQAAGSAESFAVGGLSEGPTYSCGVKVADEAANWSDLSNVVSVSTSALAAGARFVGTLRGSLQ